MNQTKFLIKPVHENATRLYTNHSTYNSGDSGLDLFIMEDTIINPRETKLVDLGIKCQLTSVGTFDPLYFSYLLYPRSSISKTPLRLANSIGLIDSGYLGNIKVALWNTSNTPFAINEGERYVQLVKADLSPIQFELVENLRETERLDGGFGSTGQ